MGTEFRLEGDNGWSNACYRWSPDGDPLALVVIAHGMGEHAQRYGRLAKALVGHGHGGARSSGIGHLLRLERPEIVVEAPGRRAGACER